MHIFCYSRSNGIEETIRCPDNMDDQAFDDFARECTEATFEIPSSWTKITMKQYDYLIFSISWKLRHIYRNIPIHEICCKFSKLKL